MTTHRSSSTPNVRSTTFRSLLIILAALTLSAVAVGATKPGIKVFDIPAGDAVDTLKRAAQQAGLEIMYPAETVRGVKTNAVKGEFTPREALDQMLARTKLTVVQDERTGALAVTRAPEQPAPPPASPSEPRAGPSASTLPSATAVAARNSGEETVQLSPFEVRTDKDTSYGALNSTSITRFNTELDKVPVSADVFTEDFMRDVGVTTVEQLLGDYGAGTGMVLATPDSDSNNNQPGDRFSVSQIGVRGLSGGNIRRDGFSIGGTNTNDTNTWNVERVEVIRGPQGLLYGAGGAGGTIVASSKQARFNRKTDRFSFRYDKYGSTRYELDANAGGKRVAARVVVLNDDVRYRRGVIGNKTQGYYTQFAFKLPMRSTLRLSGEYTANDRVIPVTLGGLNLSSADPRNNLRGPYILATHREGAIDPITGAAYPKGPILNGLFNWDTAWSLYGNASQENIINRTGTAILDTVWTSWLSSNVAVNVNRRSGLRYDNTQGLQAPQIGATNPTNDWRVGSSLSHRTDNSRQTSYRASLLATNDLFGKRAHSQTALGADYQASGSGTVQYAYYLSDANGNITRSPTNASNLGRTAIPNQFWSVTNGPVRYPVPTVGTQTIQAADGLYYTRDFIDPRGEQWVSANNPLGLAHFTQQGVSSSNNKAGFVDETKIGGVYISNYTGWFNDRFNTLLGYRETTTKTHNPNTTATIQQAYADKSKSNSSFNAGIDFKVSRSLRGYYGVSSTYNDASGSNDPLGNPPETTEGFGQEIGLKFSPANGKISGSLDYYWTKDKNQNYNYGTANRDLINPAGLNGTYDGIAGRNQWVSLDKNTSGLELILTAAPTRNWRIRFAATQSDGRVQKDKSFPIVYNDQFYTDNKGGVTYKDGSPVIVPVNPLTAPAGTPSVLSLRTQTDPATALKGVADTVQLTTAMLGSRSSPYYYGGVDSGGVPRDEPINGAIRNNNDAPVHNVLAFFNKPGVGTPLTGAVGLPISQVQYNWTDPANTGGMIVDARKGEMTVGYPALKFSLTNNYIFSDGWLKGFGAGCSINYAMDYRTYYYNNPDRSRLLFRAPNPGPQVNLILSYRRKVLKGRYEWLTQLNVTNVFNSYKIGLQPNNGTGFTNPNNIGASFYGQPREWAWTNTLSF
jgi:outer membrane receptor protein involved in Fe transport